MKNALVNSIVSVINVIWGLTGGAILFGAMYVIAYFKVKNGTASLYTDVRYADTGKKLTIWSFLKRFAVQMEAVPLVTDQGLVACVHGGFAEFIIEGKKENHFSMANKFDKGEYTLISCCNGSHQDFHFNGRSFKRDKNTISLYETILLPYNNGKLVCWADKTIRLYTCAQSVQYWKYIPKVICAKGWK